MLIIEDIKNRLNSRKLKIFSFSKYVRVTQKISFNFLLRLPNQVESENILKKCAIGSYVAIQDTKKNYFKLRKLSDTNIEADAVDLQYIDHVLTTQKISPLKWNGPNTQVTETFYGLGTRVKYKTLHVIKEYSMLDFLSHSDYTIFLMNEWDTIFKEVRSDVLLAKISKMSSDWDDLTSGKKIYHKKSARGYDEYQTLNKSTKSDYKRINEQLALKQACIIAKNSTDTVLSNCTLTNSGNTNITTTIGAF